MAHVHLLTAAEQVAEHLRAELARGRWSGSMPGGDRLSRELGIGRNTVDAALRQLEKEGVLAGRGRRRGRRIRLAARGRARRPLRVTILLNEAADRRLDYLVELLHELVEAGHAASFGSRTLVDLEVDVKRIGRFVSKTEADAWIVVAGSREVLEWFAARSIPTFALFGHRRGLPVAGAGPDKSPAMTLAVEALIHLGHKRIVLLARSRRRLPQPGAPERAFLEALAARGIPTGPYNLPEWEESREGFAARLDALFRITPPTALIVDEAPFLVAALHFLARRGIRVPADVSLVCTDDDISFAWCDPPITHIRWDSRPVVNRILRWAARVRQGRKDVRQTFTGSVFVRGGTIGPPALHGP